MSKERCRQQVLEEVRCGKGLDAGGDCVQEANGVTEDEMVGWHHRIKGHD